MIRNNQGWGLKEMLFLSALLLFFVLLIAVLVNNLYSGLEKDNLNSNTTKSNTYEQVEKNLSEAAKRYYKIHKSEVKELIVSDMLLEEKYIDMKKLTVDNDICEGYVIISENTFIPYISCAEYETEGY